jgi:two-component system sensor histidine kinase YesM
MRINKFRIKIFLLITVSLVVPVLLCCIILFTNTESTVKAYASKDMGSTLKASAQNIEAKLDVLDSASQSLLLDLARIPEVTGDTPAKTPLQIFQATQYRFMVQSSLVVDTYTINGFNHFYLYFPQKSLLIVSRMSFFEDVNYNTLDCLLIPEKSWGVATPYNHQICNPILGKYMTEKNFSRNYKMENSSVGDFILTASLKEEYISRQLSTGFQFKPDYAIIIDSHGNLLSSFDKSEIGQSIPAYHQMLAAAKNTQDQYLEMDVNGATYMLNWVYSPKNDWYYITALNVKTVTQSISSILNTMFFMLLALLIVSVSITVLVVRSTTAPLNDLNFAMREIKNKNFKMQLNADRGDEFEVIYSGFNEMAKEIGTLIQTITEEKNIKTETYIRLLQSEINPHMLYNALESLYSIAKINKQEEIADLVMALSKFFRISLSGGKRVVPFRDAFELANQYIIVQNIRMNYKIKFEYDIPEQLMSILTPKFLLQPIVENAFQYGFKNRRADCHLSIRASADGECVRIVVQDNGIGIHEQDLNHINEKINDFDFEKISGKGYALRNINYQIKLKFGNEYGLWLESVYGEYTRVNIKIPRTTEEE